MSHRGHAMEIWKTELFQIQRAQWNTIGLHCEKETNLADNILSIS